MVYNTKNKITKKTSKSNSIYTYARFISADIFIQSPTNSQSFNRYIYVWNNPLKYTDPSGYNPEGDDKDYSNGNDPDHDNDNNSWQSTNLYDDTGTNTVGTVDYNANSGEYKSYNTLDGSQEGRLGGYGYSVDADGQYTTQNLETGELDAGWNTGHYHQYTTGIETFTDSAINYHSVGIAGKNSISLTKSIYDLMNKSKDLFNQPGTKITLEGITAGIAGFKLGKYLGTKYKKRRTYGSTSCWISWIWIRINNWRLGTIWI